MLSEPHGARPTFTKRLPSPRKAAQRCGSGGGLPFLNDDDDGAQQEDEDHQTSGAHAQDQTHLLRVLGDLQSLTLVFARR